MEKEFVSYTQALALKELGFDEFCFGYYRNYGTNKFYIEFIHRLPERFRSTKAPLYQQAFRWFREKYELYHHIYQDFGWNISGGIWDIGEHEGVRYDWDSSDKFSSYEEAENACLNKLIEIVKNK